MKLIKSFIPISLIILLTSCGPSTSEVFFEKITNNDNTILGCQLKQTSGELTACLIKNKFISSQKNEYSFQLESGENIKVFPTFNTNLDISVLKFEINLSNSSKDQIDELFNKLNDFYDNKYGGKSEENYIESNTWHLSKNSKWPILIMKKRHSAITLEMNSRFQKEMYDLEQTLINEFQEPLIKKEITFWDGTIKVPKNEIWRIEGYDFIGRDEMEDIAQEKVGLLKIATFLGYKWERNSNSDFSEWIEFKFEDGKVYKFKIGDIPEEVLSKYSIEHEEICKFCELEEGKKYPLFLEINYTKSEYYTSSGHRSKMAPYSLRNIIIRSLALCGDGTYKTGGKYNTEAFYYFRIDGNCVKTNKFQEFYTKERDIYFGKKHFRPKLMTENKELKRSQAIRRNNEKQYGDKFEFKEAGFEVKTTSLLPGQKISVLPTTAYPQGMNIPFYKVHISRYKADSVKTERLLYLLNSQ